MPRVTLLPSPEPIFETLADKRLPQRFLLNASTVFLSNFILLDDPSVPLPVPLFKGIDSHTLGYVEEMGEKLLDAGVHKQLEEKTRPMSKDNTLLSLNLHKHNEWYIAVPTLWFSCDFGQANVGLGSKNTQLKNTVGEQPLHPLHVQSALYSLAFSLLLTPLYNNVTATVYSPSEYSTPTLNSSPEWRLAKMCFPSSSASSFGQMMGQPKFLPKMSLLIGIPLERRGTLEELWRC